MIRRTPYKAHTAGFSLVELIVTVSIAAVLTTVAAPSLGDFLKSRRVSTRALDLSVDLGYARTEAVKRRTEVNICRTSDLAATPLVCGGTQYDWSNGWLIFLDDNDDSTYSAADDQLLRAGRPPLTGLAVTANTTGDASIIFRPDGTTDTGGSMVTFSLCNDLGGDGAARVDVYPHGRTRIVKGTSEDPITC
jgi:type IV fimbrial biogenesis protein FimT